MLKFKFLIIIFFLFATYIITENIYNPKQVKTMYFTVWNARALNGNPTLKTITKSAKKNGFQISTTPPREMLYNPYKSNIFNRNKDINFIAWASFTLPHLSQKNQSYLWQLESPISIQIPTPATYKNHFKKIFTYHKPSCDGKQIIYTPIPYSYNNIKTNIFSLKKPTFITLVNTYFRGGHYELRIKAIQWFLENYPNDILFYGGKWRSLKPNLSKKAQSFFDTQYKGYVQDKIETISHSKFTLAFENARFDDYVTEKIFDAMAAGSVPVYSGAPNITDYVPKECFIDYHKFNDFEKLYHFLKSMNDETYNSYLKCIQNFMTNPKKHENHWENVSKKILSQIDLEPSIINWEQLLQNIKNLSNFK